MILNHTLRPKDFSGYIGQERLKENLKLAIAAAKQRGEPLRAVELSYEPGGGRQHGHVGEPHPGRKGEHRELGLRRGDEQRDADGARGVERGERALHRVALDHEAGTDAAGGSYWYQRIVHYSLYNKGPIQINATGNSNPNYTMDKKNMYWPIPYTAILANNKGKLSQNFGYDGYDGGVAKWDNWEDAVADESTN